MRLLVGFLLICVAASLPHEEFKDLDDNLSERSIKAESTLEEVKKELRTRFEEVLTKIKDAVETGKELRRDLLDKANELQQKLKDLNIHVGDKAKELFEQLREKGKDFLKELLNKLENFEKKSMHAELQANESGDKTKELKDKFDDIVQQLKDVFEHGKTLKNGLEQLQRIKEVFHELNIDLGEKGKELAEKLKEKVRTFWEHLKGKWSSKRSADIDIFGMLEQLKEMLKDMKLSDLEMKDEDLKLLKEKLSNNLKQFLRKLGLSEQRSAQVDNITNSMIGDISFRNVFLKLKQMILEKMDVTSVRASFVKIVGQGSQQLCEWLTNKGKEKLLNFFDSILETNE